jgi:large subunit ribosomal protein L4
MQLDVLDIKGKKTSKSVTLNDAVFGIEPNDHAIYLDVKQFLANQRQGTHKTKQRAEVHRTGKKLKRQKGTGGARAGSMRSPVFVGGGNAFGPQPRDYSFKLNKKVKSLARTSALSHKVRENKVLVLEDFDFATPKTKDFLEILKNLQIVDKKSLIVLGDSNKSVYLSSRNLKGSKVVNASDLNTYDILNASSLVLCESSVKKIETNLA